ncbi:DUF1704 domain-containing protein [Patescibacteria group bacterium]|nr:DUF1704 domain-containing protein [Patescibacteria group bacterium]MBU1967147.1 DUF1704 domain-containing protein [Patescibacteria group bacterium]
MSLVNKLTPINLLEEKRKFFTDENYNPQFVYEEKPAAQILYKHGYPQTKYLNLAQTILEKAYYQRNENELNELKGTLVSQQKVTQKTIDFLDIYQLKNRFKIIWSNSFVARTTITADTIKFKLPADFRQQDLLGMLYHEIGTHALRRINYEQQPWYKSKKKYGFANYLKTEEGLAGLHSLFPLNFQYAYYSALSYISVAFAQQHSFVELWNFLKKYVDHPEKRWAKTLRKKRGLEDTSQPGGFTKDLVYFEGIVKVWKYLKQNDFDITNLYLGKIALEDITKSLKMNPKFKPLLPSFFVVNKEKYASTINQIGQKNMFNQI